jgi:SOS regulatory protein LexA
VAANAPFDWKKSLDSARSALEAGNTSARAKLRKALDDAARMAEFCQDMLFDMAPGEIASGTITEWKEFLRILYKDTDRVYLRHTDLASAGSEGSLHAKFEAIRDAALKASSGLKYMDARQSGQSEQDGREAEIVRLRELTVAVQAALAEFPVGLQVVGADEPARRVETRESVDVPRLGRIAAGIPNLAEHSIEGYLPLPRQLVGNGNDCYVLEVSGDSMIGAGISDGDLVVVHEQPQAENGEIVVAMIDGEATVKTFKLIDDQAWLFPHNQAYTPTPFDEHTAIIGKVITVLRAL